MRGILCVCAILATLVAFCSGAATTCVPRLNYPEARRDDTVDDYFGTKVADPYRWLEDPDSAETKEFIEAQNSLTEPYLASSPVRNLVQERLTQMWNFPKYGTPEKAGNKYYFEKNDGLQNQNVIYVQNSLTDEPRVFFDSNTLSQDGTVSITNRIFNDDGSIWAYALSKSGSDWVTIHFKDVETGEDYPEVLTHVKFSTLTFTKDNKGFFYSRYPEEGVAPDGSQTNININQKHYYHRMNTPQSEDVLVVEFPEEPLWRIGSEVSHDGRYLFVTTVVYDFNQLYYVDLSKIDEIKEKLPLVKLVDTFEATYEYITNDGPEVTLRTNKDASRYKLIKIDLNNPSRDNWQDFIPEHSHDLLDWAVAVDHNKLVLHYLRDVRSVLQLHSLKTGEFIQSLKLETMGAVTKFSGKKDQSEIFYHFTSFLVPGLIYYMDLKNVPYKAKIFKKVEVNGFDPSPFEAKQVFYRSKDGTQIPMFIVSKKALRRNGRNPTLLYGYGGFAISIQPSFNVVQMTFMQNFNAIIAVPNIRGGGEYGEEWHKAGQVLNKQNVFDDFQAAAEYLIAERYTQPSLLTIQGASNGGLLVGACLTQRPELFGAAIAQVGVMDMLRYHKFTIGYAWAYDYGTSDNETEFRNLLKYSPLHNIHRPEEIRSEYPATLVLSADHDDRVVPLHSLKFIATLQHAVRGSVQRNPLLARIDTKAGHGGGKPTNKIIDEYADILTFIANALGLTFRK